MQNSHMRPFQKHLCPGNSVVGQYLMVVLRPSLTVPWNSRRQAFEGTAVLMQGPNWGLRVSVGKDRA